MKQIPQHLYLGEKKQDGIDAELYFILAINRQYLSIDELIVCGREGKESSNPIHLINRCTFIVFYFIYLFIFGHTIRLAGSQFPDRGLNPRPWQWKLRILTTRLPGNSLDALMH